MASVLIDNERLAATLPESFDVIPHEELEALLGIQYDCMWGVRDRDRHMLLSVTWKDSNKLLIKFANEKLLAERVDETFSKRHRKGGYRSDDLFKRAVTGADAQARGFRFAYTVEGVDQEGEVLVFKHGIRCYTLTYYTHSQVAGENRGVYEAFVSSLEIR